VCRAWHLSSLVKV